MSNLIELAKIIPTIHDEPDNIFICSGSHEERCLGSIKKIDAAYKANAVFLLKYSHKNDKREEHLKEMRHLLKDVGAIKEFSIDEESPIPILSELIHDMKQYIGSVESPKITIDVSTLIKWHLLIILKALDSEGLLSKCRFIYTEPEEYITELFQPLSFGIKKIFSIPLFSGNYDFSKGCLLAIMLGYEGDRAMGLLENIDPTECLLLIPKPAYHSEWEGRTEEMNKEIINIVGESNIRYIDSRDPLLVAQGLKSIFNENYSKYNSLISPMGTKPQTFGLYLYWITNPANTSLIYSAPLRHNDLFYSKGIGRTWVLPVK